MTHRGGGTFESPRSFLRVKSHAMCLSRPFGGLLSALALLLLVGTAHAADLAGLGASLTPGGFGDRETAIGALATSGEARAAPILEAPGAGQPYVRSAEQA